MPITLGNNNITGLGVGTGVPSNTLSGIVPVTNFDNGVVIQTVFASDVSYRTVSLGTNSTTTWVSTSLTRKRSDSKILCMFNGSYSTNSTSDTAVRLVSSLDGRLGQGSNTATNQAIFSIGTDRGNISSYFMIPAGFTFLYTPSVNNTNSITFTVQIWVEFSSVVYPNGDGWRGGGQQAHSVGSHLTLLEISQ